MFSNIVLSGGGMGAISYFGSFKYICENKELKTNLKNVLGVSAGAFFSLFLILDFTFEDCVIFIEKLKLFDMKNIKVNDILKVKSSFGIDNGNKLIDIIKLIYDMKQINYSITFKELAKSKGKNLIIATANVTKQEMFYFCVDNTPDVQVIDAVKASASIPFLFVPFIYNEEYHVDACIYNNFPMHYFKDSLDHTLGLNLVTKNTKIDGFFSYVQNLLDSIIFVNSQKDFKNECKLYTVGNGFNAKKMKFNFDEKNTNEAIEYGYETLKLFVEAKISKIRQIS
jgi:predicted acylesterase/phospholipase RssA